MRRLAILVIWIGSLSGCATSRWDEPIRDGEAVTLVVVKGAAAAGGTRIANQAMPGSTATGLGSGSLIGLAAGLSCGPFAPMCLALTLPLGATTGTLVGAAVGATGSLSEDSARKVRQRWLQVLEARDPVVDVQAALAERARTHWTIGAERPTYAVTVELQDIDLTSTRDEQIGFVMRAKVIVQSAGAESRVTPKDKVYEVVAKPVALTQWLDEGDPGFDTRWREASQQLAALIVTGLTAR